MSNNVFAILGNDEALIKREAEKLVLRVAGPHADEFTLDIYEVGDNVTPLDALKQCINSIQTPSFMGATKTVWLKSYPFETEGKKTDKDPLSLNLQQLINMITKGIPSDINLVISGFNADSRKSFFKTCQKSSELTVLDQPKITDKNWQQKVKLLISSTSEDLGLKLAGETVEYLINAFGVNTAQIQNELEKILCFCGEKKPIRIADIQDICHGQREAEYFALSTALGGRNLEEAMITIRRLLDNSKDEGSAAIGILAQASNAFKLMLQVKLFMHATKARPDQIPNKIKSLSATEKKRIEKFFPEAFSTNPWALKFKAQDAARYSGQELVEAIHILTEAYKKSVSSNCSRRLLLEYVAFQIITKQPNSAGTSRR